VDDVVRLVTDPTTSFNPRKRHICHNFRDLNLQRGNGANELII
jgi:hypothetical protein